MITEYRCVRCRHLLFKGSLKMLLAKKATDEAFVEPMCPKCGKLNRFVYQPEKEVVKHAHQANTLFENELGKG